jgi:hypothetical protein
MSRPIQMKRRRRAPFSATSLTEKKASGRSFSAPRATPARRMSTGLMSNTEQFPGYTAEECAARKSTDTEKDCFQAQSSHLRKDFTVTSHFTSDDEKEKVDRESQSLSRVSCDPGRNQTLPSEKDAYCDE